MTRQEAIGILKPEGSGPEPLRAAYRAAAMRFHPDRNPNGLEFMKLINAAYEILSKTIGAWDCSERGTGPSLDELLQTQFDKIKTIPGIISEVCGSWLWITGDTRPVKDLLKAAGFRYAAKKSAWYWHGTGYRKFGKRTWGLDEIRSTWGSAGLDQEPFQAVN